MTKTLIHTHKHPGALPGFADVGKARSAESTHAELQKQLQISIHGVKKPITDHQTITNIKDKIVQTFIDELIGEMRNKHFNTNGQETNPEKLESMLCSWKSSITMICNHPKFPILLCYKNQHACHPR